MDSTLKKRRRPSDPRLSNNYLALVKKDRRQKTCLLQPAPFQFRSTPPESPPLSQVPAKTAASQDFLLVTGLPFSTTEDQMRQLFKWQGHVQSCQLMTASTGRIAQLTFATDRELRRILLQPWNLDGVPLVVMADDGAKLQELLRAPPKDSITPTSQSSVFRGTSPTCQQSPPSTVSRGAVRLFKNPEPPPLPPPPVTPPPTMPFVPPVTPPPPRPTIWSGEKYVPPSLRRAAQEHSRAPVSEAAAPKALRPSPPIAPPPNMDARSQQAESSQVAAKDTKVIPAKDKFLEPEQQLLSACELNWLLECARDDRKLGTRRRLPLIRNRERDSWDSWPSPRRGFASFASCIATCQRLKAWEDELIRDRKKNKRPSKKLRLRQRERDATDEGNSDVPVINRKEARGHPKVMEPQAALASQNKAQELKVGDLDDVPSSSLAQLGDDGFPDNEADMSDDEFDWTKPVAPAPPDSEKELDRMVAEASDVLLRQLKDVLLEEIRLQVIRMPIRRFLRNLRMPAKPAGQPGPNAKADAEVIELSQLKTKIEAQETEDHHDQPNVAGTTSAAQLLDEEVEEERAEAERGDDAAQQILFQNMPSFKKRKMQAQPATDSSHTAEEADLKYKRRIWDETEGTCRSHDGTNPAMMSPPPVSDPQPYAGAGQESHPHPGSMMPLKKRNFDSAMHGDALPPEIPSNQPLQSEEQTSKRESSDADMSVDGQEGNAAVLSNDSFGSLEPENRYKARRLRKTVEARRRLLKAKERATEDKEEEEEEEEEVPEEEEETQPMPATPKGVSVYCPSYHAFQSEHVRWSKPPPFVQPLPSGCSRTAGLSMAQIQAMKQKWRADRAALSIGKKPMLLRELREGMFDRIAEYRGNLATPMAVSDPPGRGKRVMVSKSVIHDWGLFARQPFAKGDVILEYVGERIRSSMADIREARYAAHGIGSSYFFRVNDFEVTDATMTGNLARFINHCCKPNCQAVKTTTADGKACVVLKASQKMRVNEEFVYDYRFQREAEDKKIPCLCLASTCKRYLN